MSGNLMAADDPLAGILSDDSDDSFFDDPKFPRERKNKNPTAAKIPEKKVVSDLFNLSSSKADSKAETPVKMDDDDDWLGIKSSISKSRDSGFESEKPQQSAPSQSKTPKKISFDDDDDILGTLGLGKKTAEKVEDKKPLESTKKVNLLESILGPSKEVQKKGTSFEDILNESKVKAPDFKQGTSFEDLLKDTKTKPSELKSQTATTPLKAETQLQQSVGFSSVDAPREGRRGRRSSGGLLDPLGLFSSENKSADASQPSSLKSSAPKTPLTENPKVETLYVAKPSEINQVKNTGMQQDQGFPDWLGGSTIKPAKQEVMTPSKQENVQQIKAQTTQVPSQVESSKPVQEITTMQVTEDQSQILAPLLAQQKLVNSNIEFQNTVTALQQQESQLLMALQLKKYEENLAAIQQQQQEVLMKQEQQFNILLERQFAKQQAMEHNMKLQQERINNHIQLLLSQPALPKSIHQEEIDELEKAAKEENVKLYENMLNSLKQRQHEEIFLLEESYKKQISLLEQTMESVEGRLKTEMTKLSETYEERIKQLKEDHEEEVKKSTEKLKELEQFHLNEIRNIRENHNRIIDEIRYEHSTILETIKNTRDSENALLGNASAYAEKLDSNVQALSSSSRLLQELQEKVHKDYGVLSLAREESLKAKEQEITAMRQALEKCRESAETERAQLMALVRTLEIKLSEQNQASKEESWAFQQAAATLAARSAALDREAEFHRNSIERERDQLKTLKETMLAEQERIILQLTEEKLAMAAEKSRLETSNKLAMSYDSQKNKAELDAALQVAREAAELTDREREKLHQELCEMEILKRSLKEKERTLNLRENEMQSIIHNAERRAQEGERKIREARVIESKYNEKFKELQNQLTSLSRREKKLSEEKIALSKERLALHAMIRQNRRCGLCAADQPKADELSYHELSHDGSRLAMQMADPELVRLRIEATEDEQVDDTIAGCNFSI